MSNNTRRSTPDQTLEKLLQQFPNVEKTFQYVHTNKKGEVYPLKATYPILTREAKRITLNSYHIYVEGYNKKVRLEQLRIRKHNDHTIKLNEKKDKAKVLQTQLHFKASHGHKDVWSYNRLVVEYNDKFGRAILLKKPQTIKQSSTRFFEAFLWAYADQLMKLKKGKVASNVTPYSRAVNKMEINTKHLENIKGDMGLYLLHSCPDTILNHKNRLIEAGVLINNSFHSNKRGTQHHICDEILVVFDEFEKRFIHSDNQLVNIARPEFFRDVFPSTHTIIKPTVKRVVDNSTTQLRKKNAEGSVESDEEKAVFLASATFPLENTRADLPSATRAPRMKQNPVEKEISDAENEEKKDFSAEKKPRNATESVHSKYLRSLLLVWNVFVQNLSAKMYENSKPMHFDILKNEALNGNLSRDEFRELLISELFKVFSKIYSDHPRLQIVFAGEWKNALNNWLEGNMMMGGDGNPLCKTTALKHYQKLIFAYTDAKFGAYRQAKRSGFVAPRPSIYLDPDLKSPGTFMFHYKQVEKNAMKVIQAEQKRKAGKKQKANSNTQYSNSLKKLNRAIGQWFNSGGDYEKIYKYSANNMPPHLHKDLAMHITNYLSNLQNRISA